MHYFQGSREHRLPGGGGGGGGSLLSRVDLNRLQRDCLAFFFFFFFFFFRLQIQGSRVRSRPGTILSWRLIMK